MCFIFLVGRMSFYWALKKNWRFVQFEQQRALEEEEERQKAMYEESKGKRKYTTTKTKEIVKEDWQVIKTTQFLLHCDA